MCKIEKDLDLDNRMFHINIFDIDLEIELSKNNWGTLSGNAKIDSMSIDFCAYDDTDNIKKLFNLLNDLENFDDLIKKLSSDLTKFPVDLEIIINHDRSWSLYNDANFEKAISDFLGISVGFTEQGLQLDNMASMEVV